MTTKIKRVWLKHWKRGAWSSTSKGWVICLDDTSIAYREMATRKHDIPPKPYQGWMGKKNFYSRKYKEINKFPLPWDPFRYVRPPSSVAHQQIIEKDPIFDDDDTHYQRDKEYEEFAKKHMSAAIDSLTLPQRGVYLRRKERGMSMEEIAEELGITRQAAYQRYDRARERIKEFLKKISRKRLQMPFL